MLDRLGAWADAMAGRNYARAPLCEAPLAAPAEYRRLWTEARARTYPAIDAFEQESGAAIDPAWFHDLALLTQIAVKKSELCYEHGRLLYAALVRYTRTRGKDHLTVVETGTARGFSALCMAKALADAGASGKILTFDVLPHDAPILWNCIRDADGPRTRAALLVDYASLIERHVIFHRGDTKRELAKLSFPRVNLAVFDSVHTYEHVMAEFAAIRDAQRPGDLVFFDDYTPDAYPGVVRAADEICAVHGYAPRVISANPRRRYVIAEKQ
jgi:predicted O-methyltransferase YrrM